MTFLSSWHFSSCLAHITKCSTHSSSRRRFSSNLLSHRKLLATRKKLEPCEPFFSSHSSRIFWTKLQLVKCHFHDVTLVQVLLHLCNNRSVVRRLWMSVLIFFLTNAKFLVLRLHLSRRILQQRPRACCGTGGEMVVSSLVFRHHSCLLDFLQKTLCVLWRERGSAAQPLRNRPHSQEGKGQSHQAQRERHSRLTHRKPHSPTKTTLFNSAVGQKSSKTSLDTGLNAFF